MMDDALYVEAIVMQALRYYCWRLIPIKEIKKLIAIAGTGQPKAASWSVAALC